MTRIEAPSTPSRIWLAVAVAAGLQTLVLAWMVWGRVDLLTNGREIVAEVLPVDPRDLFRGDYVILGYGFTGTGDIELPAGARVGDAAYATLAKGADSKWQLKSVASSYPDAVPASDVVLKGRVDYVVPPGPGKTRPTGRLRYGIESYFVPEGTGLELEQKVRDQRIEAVLAVGSGGDVAIKALRVDGQTLVQEPAL